MLIRTQVLVRLAWHASGTYDKETGTGGSGGATMRFSPEAEHGANAGLKHARDFLEPVKRTPLSCRLRGCQVVVNVLFRAIPLDLVR
jgi:Peroxidase